MKKVLVLGSEGYLGSVLIPYLAKSNLKITGVDRCFFGKHNKNTNKVKIIKADYSKLNKSFFKNYEIIVDLVNISNDPASELNKNFTMKVNYKDKLTLYKKIEKLGNIKKYVYMSSCSVYGNNKNLISEKSKPKPISLYSKLCLKYENYLKRKKNIDYTILRLGTLYGWSNRMRYDIAINKIIRDMLFVKKVEILGGEQLRFFCYNKFACNVINKVILEKSYKYKNKVFNIGVFNTNIINLAKKIIKITKYRKASLIHEKYNIDNRSYEVSLKSVKNMFANLNFNNYVKKSIIETYNKIRTDKAPFKRNKVTLNVYKEYLTR